ncbi:hypothetical protein BBP40_003570 [Aspergillus hancockii]|nr:hypothetical protein BBP40_003570 [Aspergillus hancockii]
MANCFAPPMPGPGGRYLWDEKFRYCVIAANSEQWGKVPKIWIPYKFKPKQPETPADEPPIQADISGKRKKKERPEVVLQFQEYRKGVQEYNIQRYFNHVGVKWDIKKRVRIDGYHVSTTSEEKYRQALLVPGLLNDKGGGLQLDVICGDQDEIEKKWNRPVDYSQWKNVNEDGKRRDSRSMLAGIGFLLQSEQLLYVMSCFSLRV